MCAALYLELLVAAIFGGKKAGMAQLPGGATEGRETYRYAASSYRAKSNEGELRKEDSGSQTLCQGYGLQDLCAQGVNRILLCSMTATCCFIWVLHTYPNTIINI